MENESSPTVRVLPLDQLIDISPGQTRVSLRSDLLSQVDLTTLTHTLRVELKDSPHIEAHLIPCSSVILCRVHVVTLECDWPDQTAFEVYDTALKAAVSNRVRTQADDDDITFIRSCDHGMVKFEFTMAQPVLGRAILAKLQTEVERLFDELRQLLQIVGDGPDAERYLQEAVSRSKAALKSRG